MKINQVYRITSHRQTVEVDNASATPNKVSNKILLVENELPADSIMEQLLMHSAVGIVLVIDAFDKEAMKPFDIITGAESPLMVIKNSTVDGLKAVYSLPNDYQTFYLGQELLHEPKVFKARVVTLSDRAYRGIYEDRSGPLAVQQLEDYFKSLGKPLEIQAIVIPDDVESLQQVLNDCKQDKIDVLITTGGTGIGLRDITVNTVKPFLDKEIPGIMEMIRVKYGAEKPNALLSTGVSGVMETTLVYTLPGSVKAVNEYLAEIFNTMDHLFYMLHGIDNH